MVYAKSKPLGNPQDLWTHSQDVLKNAQMLQGMYGSLDFLGPQKKYFWDALFIASKCHDLGKLNAQFQHTICSAINAQRKKSGINASEIDLQQLKTRKNKISDIPHNILSPAFMLGELERFPKNIRACICSAVAFHHNRGLKFATNLMWSQVKLAIDTDLKPLAEMSELRDLFKGDVVIGNKYKNMLAEIPDEDKDFYVMLKGLLHRADYTASAGTDISVNAPLYNRDVINRHIRKLATDHSTKAWQISALKNNFDENIIMQAGTGMGKTEFALYWAAGSKTFYTLPLRTSTNAIYERIKNTFEMGMNQVGLLHSSTREYFFSQHTKENDSIVPSSDMINTMRQMSMPISVSTADQIFTSVFHYPGYERIYATMAGSKVIVDELQAYNPEIIAVMLHGLKDFEYLGAKFCIITATLPEFCIDYLQKKIPDITIPSPQYEKRPRHKMCLIDGRLDGDTINSIIKSHKQEKKFLIIINKVDTAIAIKRDLDALGVKSNLLHSRFTQKDRYEKENNEKTGILKTEKGIWITTQVVEASVDIDFDVLITEVSTMDSQIQRWGRVWRKRKRGAYKKHKPNIYIAQEPSDEGKIYDQRLVSKTLAALEHKQKRALSDCETTKLFGHVFSNTSLEDTDYFSSFQKSLEMLEDIGYDAESKRTAQRLFRDIDGVSVIPRSVYDKDKDEIDAMLQKLHNTIYDTRTRAIIYLRYLSVSVPYYWLKSKHQTLDEDYGIMVGDVNYSFEFGAERK